MTALPTLPDNHGNRLTRFHGSAVAFQPHLHQSADQLVRVQPEPLDTNLEEIEAELSRNLEGGQPL